MQERLNFIESVLIPSFHPRTILETPEDRDAWLAKRAQEKGWETKLATELIKRYGAVESLQQAQEEKAGVEKRVVRAEEIESLRGKTSLVFIVLHHWFEWPTYFFDCFRSLVSGRDHVNDEP